MAAYSRIKASFMPLLALDTNPWDVASTCALRQSVSEIDAMFSTTEPKLEKSLTATWRVLVGGADVMKSHRPAKETEYQPKEVRHGLDRTALQHRRPV